MPYIDQKVRELYDLPIKDLMWRLDHTSSSEAAGAFTYIVYKLLQRFNRHFWHRALGIGCLICAILEIYRREHAPYEDQKIKENGDVE